MSITNKTASIRQALICGDGGRLPTDWGFRSYLARKHGISRQRISTIAAGMGLTHEIKAKRNSLINGRRPARWPRGSRRGTSLR